MYIEGKTNQRVSKGKQKQLKNLLVSCHTCFSNTYKRIMRKKSKYRGIVSNCAVILLILSSFIFLIKASKSFSSCEKTEIETAIHVNVSSKVNIIIKIKIAICLTITSRKISNHTEDSPRIYTADR